MSGRNSVVECYLAKVDVDGSNPFARSIFLKELWRHSQVVRQRSAKPLFTGSNPVAASIFHFRRLPHNCAFIIFLSFLPPPNSCGNKLQRKPRKYCNNCVFMPPVGGAVDNVTQKDSCAVVL